MIKRLLYVLSVTIFLIEGQSASSQSLSVNTDGSAAHPSALLEVKSTNKGILIPRMTDSQRNAIVNPATGLMIFQTGADSIGFHYYDGNKWIMVGTASELYWNKRALTNTVYNVNSTLIGINTDSAQADFHVNAPKKILFGSDSSGIGTKFIYSGVRGAVRFGYLASTKSWNDDSLGLNSFGFGYNARAKGDYSLAGGYLDSSLGLYSVALGGLNLAGGGSGATAIGFANKTTQGGVAIGTNNISSGSNSVALGVQNTSSNSGSVASGINNTASGFYSFATGQLTKATGTGSFTAGFSTLAAGLYSVAMGSLDTASGSYTLAQGYQNNVSLTADYSMAIGFGNHVSGSTSAAIGSTHTVSGVGSFAWGAFCRVLGAYSTAGGYNCTSNSTNGYDFSAGLNNNATGGYSVALGQSNTSSGLNSFVANYNNISSGSAAFATGTLTKAFGDYSFTGNSSTKTGNTATSAFGFQTISNGKYGLVAGLYNDSLLAPNSGFPLITSPLFVVGNGTSTTRSNAMVVTNEGVSSFAMNPINGGNADGVLEVKTFGLKDNIELYSSSLSDKWGFYVTNDMDLYYNGFDKGYFSSASGAYINVSDKRLKKDISPLESVVPRIKLLQPASYHYLDNKPSDSYTMGFMAQDFYKLFPELTSFHINKKGEKYYGINYNNISVLAIKAIQEQQERIESLTNENRELKNKLEAIAKRMDQIENKVNH